MNLIDTNSVLEIVGVSRPTLHLLRKNKGFPGPVEKHGVKIMFNADSIEKWIKETGFQRQEGGGGTIDLSGKKFGKLTVREKIGSDKNGNAVWIAHCECGNIKTTNSALLRRGKVLSCGCLHGAHLAYYREVAS